MAVKRMTKEEQRPANIMMWMRQGFDCVDAETGEDLSAKAAPAFGKVKNSTPFQNGRAKAQAEIGMRVGNASLSKADHDHNSRVVHDEQKAAAKRIGIPSKGEQVMWGKDKVTIIDANAYQVYFKYRGDTYGVGLSEITRL